MVVTYKINRWTVKPIVPRPTRFAKQAAWS